MTDEIEARYLPPLLREIVARTDLAAALALVRAYGGIRLYVPVKFDPDHPLAKLIGHAHLAALVERYAGDILEIPKGEIAVKAARDKQIRAERGSYSQAQLALRHGLTERHIRTILGPEEEDDRQIGMF